MKGLILALVLTFVGGQKQDLEPVFHIGKTYLYGYESFILHGLPNRGLATAGVRLTCQVEISHVSHHDHLLQIQSPNLEEYNGFWPTDPFTPSSRFTQTIAACFSQAFKFEYTEGRVGNIFAPEDSPILCINLVRGILNMMHITIKKSQNVYELQEDGIEGICHTRYIIQDDSKNNRATISKSKDLMNCREKVVRNMGMAYIRPCPTCALKVRNVKGMVVFTYQMKYDDSGALMMSATSRQVYHISPFNEANAAATMEARQELSLIDIKTSLNSTRTTQLQNQGSLHYHFSGELLQMPIPLVRITNPDLQLTETLQQLVQNNKAGATKEASAKFLQMVQLLRIVTLDQIEFLWVQFAHNHPYRHWFLSAICAAGATDTFRFLKQKIHDEKLNIWEATVALPLAFHFITPNKQILEVASTFLTCPQIQKVPMYRIIVYLAYGSMVNKYCAQIALCPNEFLQPLHDLATEATSKGDAKGMSLALKAIGNAGEPASIKRILKFLPTFSPAAVSLPNRIHVDAVLALRKIARKYPAKVREISLQVFMDNTLAPNVRMVACVLLFETKPALPTVTALAVSLLTEPSLQVASFTYSHMKALAAGRIPQLYSLSAACNIAIKLLSPRLDRLSYRYSKVIHVGDYSSEYQAGAIWRLYLMNSPSTVIPSDIITKVRGYYANTATDIIEVALRSQSLTDLIRKQNIPFAEHNTYKTLKELSKTLLGWKELPLEDPLVSAYVKVLGQEIAFADIDKDVIQQTMLSLTGSSNWQVVVKKVVEEVQRGISSQWTLPVVVGELRYIVPTVVGVPLELGLCGVMLSEAAADVGVDVSPPLSDNFRPSQLLESNVDIHADIKPKAYFHMIAMMGINTQYIQSGLEFHAEFSANATMKFDARINLKEKNLKIEALPCHQEIELIAVRSEVYAISRNMEEADTEKKTHLLPIEVPSTSDQPFQSSGRSSRLEWKVRKPLTTYIADKKQAAPQRRLYTHSYCGKLESVGCSACLSLKAQHSPFLRNTYLHKLIGKFEGKILLMPVETDADIDKIELEIQAGPKAASKIIDVASSGSKDEEEPSPYEDIQAKLEKILGIDNVFEVRDLEHQRGKYFPINETKNFQSGKLAWKAKVWPGRNVFRQIYLFTSFGSSQQMNRKVLNSSSPSASGEGISRALSQPKFLGDSKPPVLAAVLRAIHRNKQPTGLQLVLYTDTQPMRFRIQVFVSSITASSSRWKLCADASLINSHKVSGSLKWGKDCKDYQIATQIATGHFAAYPAMQMKLEWAKVPSTVRKTAGWFYSFVPEAAYVLGYSQKQQRGPSHRATLVMALTSPRTFDMVLKLPELTIYDRAIKLPLLFDSSPGTLLSTLPAADQNVFSQATLLIAENFKARCSVFQNVITTFNGVEFNYSMPANCYHVLVQDCSPELKFLVMMKIPEESSDLTSINVRLASHEVDMYVSNGLIQLKINGVQAPTDAPYTSNSDESMLISREKEGLSLKAPDYGIDKLYYDGHRLEVQVAFWMAGKTCGICGKYDAEKDREYQMPSGYLAKDAVSFGQSWIISEDPCTGACKLQRKVVTVEKSVAFEKKAAKCFSVEPILHCVEGCRATRTVPVSVGFHCIPADSALNLEGQTKLDKKSEDVVSRVSAHTACSCEHQTCPA
ncbi:Vitellogenin-2 [Dryobates pubescens]|uniref:Vitellogenin-2 n=1 Tax=Dryobates pubescens TaxID=118200 RepID=A0A093GKF5_DRYPU|nr:Vitellogenin-2 [Dryobates pubescens]